jgi:hypothetical protein
VAWEALADALLADEEVRAAEAALRRVLDLDPRNAAAATGLDRLLREMGRKPRPEAPAPLSLEERYRVACLTPSDLNEHLPALHALARECLHVTDLGTGDGAAATAFLFARPEALACYDKVRTAEAAALAAVAGATRLTFHEADVLRADIEETDLLFIDTWHVHEQLQEELARHAGKVRKYVVVHGTVTYAEEGESPGHRGLWPAVEELLAQGRFRVKQRFAHNHGLTVLEAV